VEMAGIPAAASKGLRHHPRELRRCVADLGKLI
jgi:hypothetical protein